MIKKKFNKLIGLKKEDFDSFVEEGQIHLQDARLIPTLKTLDKDSSLIDRGSYIDPFVDGNAQNRMAEYIQSLLSSVEKSKSNMIRESNIIYKRKYGNDKVLEKEGL